ncbi:MAG: hypothetical protein GY790_04425 [Bacteroidetes bacterium]|nr:hypothetical protein [Bacteroidota bacterium]
MRRRAFLSGFILTLLFFQALAIKLTEVRIVSKKYLMVCFSERENGPLSLPVQYLLAIEFYYVD